MESRKTAVRLRPKRHGNSERPEPAYRAAVFTSIDGTLLDAKTFEPGPARAAAQRVLEAGIPIVPVTVMTLDEIAPVAADLKLRHTMIIEAGGAIARWAAGEWIVEPCGPPVDTLLEVVRAIESRSGADLLVYSALSPVDAARVSGRRGDMLTASTARRFSEPLLIESGDYDKVKSAAAELGFTVRRGRRFLHLCRECDEGEAFARVRDELSCETTAGLGGATIDAEFLARVDVPILIPGPDGTVDDELRARVPRARIATAPGPEGWASAVDEMLPRLTSSRRRARRA